MRIIRSLNLTILLTLWACGAAFSQSAKNQDLPSDTYDFAPIEVGLLAGVSSTYGDLGDTKFGRASSANAAYGLFVRYQADPNLSFRANFLRGQLSGSDLESEKLAQRGLQFSSPLTELSVVGEWDFLGQRRYSKGGGFRPTISPFVYLGFGVASTKTDVDLSELNGNPGTWEELRLDLSNDQNMHIVIPAGIGVKMDINRDLLLSLQMGLRPVFNDYLDGVSLAANEEHNDWYSVGSVSVAYRFGRKDRDKDGVADRMDPCPGLAGPKEMMGCPDSDGDGISESKDQCPEEPGSEATNGCPDTDLDGVADYEDSCPNVRGSIAANGCPDRDKDGVVDAEDQCPDLFGDANMQGCRDADKDGISDTEDECPYAKGPASRNGCPEPADMPEPAEEALVEETPEEEPEVMAAEAPLAEATVEEPTEQEGPLDSDNDGVIDSEDDCPYLPGKAALNGCRDTDEDGIADQLDQCPRLKGPAERNGCPVFDRDQDGIEDKDDPCPDKAGELGGCPDTDGDGLADNLDHCPELQGPKDKNGCPDLSSEDQAILDDAMENIGFLTGRYKLRSTDFGSLDRIADLMNRYPTYHLKIEGHTDNQGDGQGKLLLSEMRAKSCYDYLHEEGGIDKERMSYKGYGGTRPRATNETISGRRRNRRVEFTIFDPNE